jgi:hypothetical protein
MKVTEKEKIIRSIKKAISTACGQRLEFRNNPQTLEAITRSSTAAIKKFVSPAYEIICDETNNTDKDCKDGLIHVTLRIKKESNDL